MLKCSECVYYERDEETGFGTCLFSEADKFAPCEEEDDPVYENEDYDNMSDEDWEQELNSEEDFDDEKVFE